jgi:hypothetical protein
VDSDKGSIFTWIVTRPCDQTKPKTKINISKKTCYTPDLIKSLPDNLSNEN